MDMRLVAISIVSMGLLGCGNVGLKKSESGTEAPDYQLRMYDVRALKMKDEKLVQLIREKVDPKRWVGPASITIRRRHLIVNQIPDVHKVIEKTLVDLRPRS